MYYKYDNYIDSVLFKEISYHSLQPLRLYSTICVTATLMLRRFKQAFESQNICGSATSFYEGV